MPSMTMWIETTLRRVLFQSKKSKKRARTAGVSATRAENLKKRFEKKIAKLGGAVPWKSSFKPRH